MTTHVRWYIFSNRDGALKLTQTSTQNLSMAVSELFWKMVKDNIEQQADAFKGTYCEISLLWQPAILTKCGLN